MRGGKQSFRIRSYITDEESHCTSWYDFDNHVENCKTYSLEWTVKSYTDDEIVLNGCAGDEYKYTRNSKYDEKIIESNEK